MATRPFSASAKHNAACETASQADCKCFCHGAGHQNDLVIRAVDCPDATELSRLASDLENAFGSFHADERDINSRSRRSHLVPSSSEIATLKLATGKGATWVETLLVDEGIHAAFIAAARGSMALTGTARQAHRKFVEGVTMRAIGIVGSQVTLTNVVESHVWCSIVAEFLAGLSPHTPSEPASVDFAAICYPRRSIGAAPTSLPAVKAAGIDHLNAEYRSATTIADADKIALLQLVGAATCPDLWHHSAAVRYCLKPAVDSASWPPSNTTTVATNPTFRRLRISWRNRGHW